MNREALKERLRLAEGGRSADGRFHAYQDSLGYWTIGYGHCIDARKGGTMPLDIDALFPPPRNWSFAYFVDERAAEIMLDEDIDRVERALDLSLNWWTDLDEARQNVLAELTFQVGIGNLLGFHDMLAAIRAQHWHDAFDALIDSVYASQVPERALDLAISLRAGSYP